MTSRNPALTGLVEWLVRQGGGYLRNTVWLPAVTCTTCATPVSAGYKLCIPCNSATLDFPDQLADLVGSIFYGVQGHQSGFMMRQYKSSAATALQRAILSGLLNATAHLHFPCIARLVGSQPDLTVTVPSTNGRTGPHPLENVVGNARLGLRSVPLSASLQQSGSQHQVLRGLFTIASTHAVQGKHVLVVDDTWTAGGNEQSAALALKMAGAKAVTVLTLARWLNLKFGGNRSFAAAHLNEDFNPARCPFGYAGCCAGDVLTGR